MPASAIRQRSVLDATPAGALRLPLGEHLAALHPGGCFPLVEDPRSTSRALILGMMVLRPASERWLPPVDDAGAFVASLREQRRWCYDVEGLGGSWPVSGGNAMDALRLALQYGTVDAVMAGATTVLREGVDAPGRRAHLWQPYTPLSWKVLEPHRDRLEPSIASLRRDWQELGVLSARRWPAQILVSRSGRNPRGDCGLLDARIFRARHPDGSAMESLVLTSEQGAQALREEARSHGASADALLLACSPPGDPTAIDVTRVASLLRGKLDARLVEHDGGALSLSAFADAGAVAQMNLTVMRGRSVREIVEGSPRIDAVTRAMVLGDWDDRARYFPAGGTPLPRSWRPIYAVEEEAGEAVAVTFDLGAVTSSP